MARSTAATVPEYLARLPKDRRALLSAVRQVVLRHLPEGYRETMSGGMIAYVIPLERYPKTYNGQPLWYAALAAQKNYCALHLMSVYANATGTAAFKNAFARAGKKLDMGKACVRFKRLEDLELDAIGAVIAGTTPDDFSALCEKSRRR